MNRYEEAMDIIELSLDYAQLEEARNLLKELIDEHEKYKWHDLEKNPLDLPTIQKDVLIRYLWKDGNLYYALNGLIDEETWEIEDYANSFNYQVKVFAWKYIQEYEKCIKD